MLCPDTTGVALEFDTQRLPARHGFFVYEQIGIEVRWPYTITSFDDGAVVATGSLDDAATAIDVDNYVGNDEGSDFFCLHLVATALKSPVEIPICNWLGPAVGRRNTPVGGAPPTAAGEACHRCGNVHSDHW